MRGRPRKPTAVALLHNVDREHATRWRKQQRDKEPTNTDPLPADPPEYFTELQRDCYQEIIVGCHKDVLTIADAQMVEIIAVLLAKFRERRGDVHPNIIGKLFSGFDRLGMSPSARSKVQAVKRGEDEKDNPLSEFAA